jgi:UDP-N-acetylmuramate--alanine ligase
MLLVHQRVASHFGKHPGAVSYALDHTGTPRAEHVHVDTGRYVFDLVAEGHTLRDLQLGMPGRHNVENALAASTMALRLGITPEALRAGLASFKGVSRRFEVRVNGPKVVFIDDYAHHPKELEACIGSARELHPGKRITGIFQPHLFSRTHDLAVDFARVLATLDELFLLEIYPAREEPMPGITSQWLLDQVPMVNKVLVSKDGLLDLLRGHGTEVLLTMGAGDIDRLVPSIERLLNEHDRP